MPISQTTRRNVLAVDRMLNTDFEASVKSRRELDPRLRDHQVQAVHHLQDHPRAALFLEMGL